MSIPKGETRTVSFTLTDRGLSVVDGDGVRGVAPGKVELWVGGGQPLANTAGAKAELAVTGSAVLPK